MFHLPNLNKNILTVIYKLLHDLLFLSLLFLLGVLLAEGILPGVITTHIGFSKKILFIGFVLGLIYLINHSLGLERPVQRINKKIAFLLLSFLFFITFASLWKAGLFINLLVLTCLSVTGYYLYKVILEE